MYRKRVTFVGDATHHEFQNAISWLREYCLLKIVEMPEAAAHILHAAEPPDAIVFAQARPDIFEQSQIEALARCAPLSRLIALVGGWCDGELRTGRPWRGVVRVAWHQFVPRLAGELCGGERNALLAQARTSTDIDGLLSRISVPDVEQPGLIIIKTPDVDSYSALSDACTQIGHATVWSPKHLRSFSSGAMFGIWDCAQSVAYDQAALRSFVTDLAPTPVIALLGFPRTTDFRAALSNGASAVISKPFLLQDLWSELTRVTLHASSSCVRASAA